MRRLLASGFAAALAFLVARDCGLPAWGPIGDACDLAVSVLLTMWFTLGYLRKGEAA